MAAMSIGFTGTRHGATDAQMETVREILDDTLALEGFAAHHGLCVGADAQFHALCREPRGGPVTIVGHPGPDWPDGDLCARLACDSIHEPLPHMERNRAIVYSSAIMIATPPCDDPRKRGGTWSTIRIALRSLRTKRIRGLFVIGRDGCVLDHNRWPA